MKSDLDFTELDRRSAARKQALVELATLIDNEAMPALHHARSVQTFLYRLEMAYDLVDEEARQLLPPDTKHALDQLGRLNELVGELINNADGQGNVRGLQMLAADAEDPREASPEPTSEPAVPGQALHVYTAVVMRPEYVLTDFHDQPSNPWVGVVHAVGPAEAVERARQLAAAHDTETLANDPPTQDIEPDDYTVAALFAGAHHNQLGD